MEENNEKNVKINKKIIILPLILIFILGIVVYFLTDLFKTPEQLFKKYLINGVMQISQTDIRPFGEIFERAKKEPLEITILNKNNALGIGNSSITETIALDIPNNKALLNANIKFDDKDIIKLSMILSNNELGIYFHEFYEKYITIENRDLKKLAEVAEVEKEILENIPNAITTISFSEEETKTLKKIALNSIKNIFSQIDKEFYKKEKYISNDFIEESIDGNKYVLTIPDMILKNIIINESKKLMLNEEFLFILEQKKSKEELDAIKDEINKLQIVESTTEEKNIEISVYESKGETVRINIIDSDKKEIQLTGFNEEDTHLIAKVIMPKAEQNLVGYEKIFDFKNKNENNNGEMSLNFQVKYNKDDISTLKKEITSSPLIFILDQRNAEIYDLSKYEDKNILLKGNTVSNGNIINSKIIFDDNVNEKKEISVDFNFEKEINIEEIPENKKIVINDFVKEEFLNLKDQILKNAQKNIASNLNSFVNIINFATIFENNSITNETTDSTENSATNSMTDVTTNSETENSLIDSIINSTTNLMTDFVTDFEKSLETTDTVDPTNITDATNTTDTETDSTINSEIQSFFNIIKDSAQEIYSGTAITEQ